MRVKYLAAPQIRAKLPKQALYAREGLTLMSARSGAAPAAEPSMRPVMRA